MPSIYARELKKRTTWYAGVQNTSGVLMKDRKPKAWIYYDTEVPAPKREKDESEQEWRKRIKDDESGQAALEHARTIQTKLDEYPKTKINPFDGSGSIGDQIGELRERYIEYCVERNVASNTIRRYKETLARLPDISVQSFDKAALAIFKAKSAGNATATRNGRLADLRAFLNWVSREITYTPPRIELAQDDDVPEIEGYSNEECTRILIAAESVTIGQPGGGGFLFPFKLFLQVLLLTGLRLKEAATLRWERPTHRSDLSTWIDLEHDQIVVPAPVAKGKRTRYVPIFSELRTLLEAWPHKTGRLFPFSATSGRIRDKWVLIKTAAKVPDFPIKCLRATFARLLREKGVDIDTIMEILGHVDSKTTKRYYAQLGSPSVQVMLKRPEFTTPILQIESNSLSNNADKKYS